MGQIRFECPKSKVIKERFPDAECWSCNQCSDEGNRLFKGFLCQEIENGHIYHRLKPQEPDPDYSGDATGSNSS